MISSLWRSKFVRDTLVLQVGKFGVTGLSVISSVLVFRLLGADQFGIWALAQSFFALTQSFNLTGVDISTKTRLPMAVGRRDHDEILKLMIFYIHVSALWAGAVTAVVALLGPSIAERAYDGDGRIGLLAAWLSLTVFPDALYNLVIMSLQSTRRMRVLASLQNANQFVLVMSVLVVLLVSPTVDGMVLSRLLYSVLTMSMALVVYEWLRRKDDSFPPLRRLISLKWQSLPREYWNFGIANAIDKNLSRLFLILPMQLLGIIHGPTATGYLELAFRALTLPQIIASALFENVQAVVPQAVGRGDFRRLWKNILRLLGVLLVASCIFFGIFAVVAHVLVPFAYGAEAEPAVPVVTVLMLYGVITTVGGVFGPLYRSLSLVRSALLVKLLSLMVITIPGVMLIRAEGPLGGAWYINGLFILSVTLTAAVTLPELRRRSLATNR